MSSTAVPVKAKSTLRFAAGVLLLAALHIAALGVMFWSEDDVLAKVVFLLAWSLLNFSGWSCCAAPRRQARCR